MNRIPRTDDSRLNVLIRQVEKHHARRVKNGEYNRFHVTPSTQYVALTELSFTNALVWGIDGGIIDDTLANPRQLDCGVLSEVRVGTREGTGVGYNSGLVTLKGDLRALEKIVNLQCNQSFESSIESYCDFYGQSLVQKNVNFPRLVEVEPQRNLDSSKKHKIPLDKLRRIVKESSRILNKLGDTGNAKVSIKEEVRRYVNSEGTVIRDNFFGYRLLLAIKSRDASGRDEDYSQGFYFTRNSDLDEKRIYNFAEYMVREVAKRKDCSPFGTIVCPVMYTPDSLASELHECFAHLLASDMILDYSTIFGWENYGQPVASKYLQVAADPGMPNRWGSFKFDYEGIPSQRRQLIENGKIVGYLADRNGAFHLSKRIGTNVSPGDCRFDMTNNGDFFEPQPRISNLDINYTALNRPRSKKAMFQRFLQLLKKQGTNGIYIPEGSDAESEMDTGRISCFYNFPYLVSPDGKMSPTKFIFTSSYASNFLKNIVVMGEPRAYIPHYCGDGEEQASVRAGILCGPAIVNNVQVTSYRPEERKQKMI
ncbi:hypothetical protein J4437_02720 [Candidatus Woesearchaeota archaeon]|nr:hypothetical protein [Candidatus Woesearchaeota archaeon]